MAALLYGCSCGLPLDSPVHYGPTSLDLLRARDDARTALRIAAEAIKKVNRVTDSDEESALQACVLAESALFRHHERQKKS